MSATTHILNMFTLHCAHKIWKSTCKIARWHKLLVSKWHGFIKEAPMIYKPVGIYDCLLKLILCEVTLVQKLSTDWCSAEFYMFIICTKYYDLWTLKSLQLCQEAKIVSVTNTWPLFRNMSNIPQMHCLSYDMFYWI